MNRNYVLSGSEDNNAYIWDLQSKVSGHFVLEWKTSHFFFPLQEVLQVLTGHSAPVVGVDFHPTKNIIATSSLNDDPTIRIWTSTVGNQ